MEHLGGVNFHGRPQYDSDGLITSSEVATISGSLQTNIDEKSNNDHIHDDRYYTESEVDTISGTLSAEIDSDIVAHTSNADAHHTESHTIVSHSDTTATGANLNELVGVGDTALHKHDGQYYTESEVDTISGSLQTNINGKPDTEVFLVEGVPSGAIGKENDIAVDQETGDVYEKCSSSNYTTYNPSDKSAQIVLSNGNLTATNSASSDAASVRSVLGKLSGKYYWEVTISESVTEFLKIGIGNSSANIEDFPGKNINSYGHGAGGGKYYNDNWQEYGDSFTEGDTVSIALDMDNGKVWWAKNGVWQASGDPASGTNEAFSGINGTFYSMDSPGFTSGESVTANFGMSSFLYSVPSGFTAGLSLVTEVEWSKKLSPDFLKLSDTPSTYSEAADKYLKTTNSGIEFSDDELYTKSEVDTISGSLQTNIDSKSDTSHIHDDRYYTESEIDDIITTISGKLDDHNELNNLDYASSGHTGFQPAGDYATDSELTSVSGILQINIDGKSDVVHTHDDRYY
ncbi:MAG: hypothetical protein KAR21_18245, partial [Spirochaetales bacterium]|nr:hypothetical protein [Spirochaetales bacterium]